MGRATTPRLVAGQLSAADLHAVSEWIRLNEAALLAYWDCQIDTAEIDPARTAVVGAGVALNEPRIAEQIIGGTFWWAG
jgi:hypothetical protein